MKIADSDNIKAGEQELISSIMEKLDPETLAQVASKHLSPEQLEFLNGDLVIQENRIVYKMDFRATLDISVMFDRHGDLVPMDEDRQPVEMPGADEEDTWEPEDRIEDVNEDIHDNAAQPDTNDAIIETKAQSLDDEMAQVFSRTRDFWEKKQEKALGETDLPEASGDS